jgi:hypothetical protein
VRCHNCGVPEGQEHRVGCTAEVCPGCGAQAIGHRCRRAARLPRVPFLHFPSVCARCGAVEPPWFGVPDAVWAYYVPPYEREAILCETCFKTIVRLIDRYRPRPDGLPTDAEIAAYRILWSHFQRSRLRCPARRRLAAELEALDAAYSARRAVTKADKGAVRRPTRPPANPSRARQ